MENESAQFGIANIPFGIVSTSHDAHRKAATRYLDKVLLLPDLIANGHFAETGIQAETLASLSEVRCQSCWRQDWLTNKGSQRSTDSQN